MSLPPQIISIKRRINDDPVDTLYVDRGKRRFTEQAFHFRRHVGFEPASEAFSEASALPQSSAALAESNVKIIPQNDVPAGHTALGSPSKLQPAVKGAQSLNKSASATNIPRMFYLSASDKMLAPPLGPISLKKRKTGHVGDVAVFVEEVTAQLANPLEANETEMSREDKAVYQDLLKQALGSEYTEPNVQPIAGMKRPLSKRDAQTTSDDVNTTSEEFVYDTYIRQPEDVPAGGNEADVPSKGGGIGYLVITDQDLPLWEAYAEDGDESDEVDWDSEHDDENAENYYGADYPEDEVASEDEFNGNSYRYRKNASDDEEYGSADDVWSDDGDADRFPWGKR